MQHGNTGWTCSSTCCTDIHGHLDMQYLHKCCTDMHLGEAAWMQLGYASLKCTLTCSKDLQHGTCSVDMQRGHSV
jgi:hypothetical protein